MGEHKSRTWLFFLLGFLICAIGWTNPFVLDDGSKILGNPDIRSLSNIFTKLIYPYQGHLTLERNDPSRPLISLIHTLLYSLNGAQPFLFHLTSSVIHGTSCALAYILLSALFSEHRKIGLFAALFFAVAPIQTGSVLYAYGMSDLLSSALILGALYFFWNGTVKARRISLFLYAFSLLCKQSAVVLPALLALTEYLLASTSPGAKRSNIWKNVRWYAYLTLGFLAWRAFYFGSLGDIEGEGNTHPAFAYLLSEGALVWKYIFLAFVPRGLSIDHYILPSNVSLQTSIAGWLALIICTFIIFKTYRLNPKSSLNRAVFWGWFWFLICWAPTSTVFPTVDLFVERRTYLANLGLYFAAFAFLARFAERIPGGLKLLGYTGIVATIVLGGVSLRRSRIWHTVDGIWNETLAIYPTSPRALNNLGTYWVSVRQYVRARETFEKLISIFPKDAYAYSNLGTLFENEESPFHNTAQAESFFLHSLELQPNFVESLYNLGRLYQKRNDIAQAEANYIKTLELKPQHVPALNNLGVIEMNRGQIDKARNLFNRGLELDPSYPPLWSNLARLNREVSTANPMISPPPPPQKTQATQEQPPPGAHEVPLESVNSDVIIQTYLRHLKVHPDDKNAKKAFRDFCMSRKLNCGR